MLGRCTVLACLVIAAALASARAQQAAAPAPEAAPVPALSYSQPLGADAVKAVQDKLSAAGYSTPADGNWSDGSEAALRSFQQARGLQPTGQMNQATAATLGLDPATLLGFAPGQAPAASAEASPPPPPTPAKPFALGDNSVRMLQSRLSDLGFYHGVIDGVWGGGSQAALINFQSTHDLPADGRITEATVRALGIDPAAMQPR